jgi:hypothetical protein
MGFDFMGLWLWVCRRGFMVAWVCGYGFAGMGLWWLWVEVGGIWWPWVSGFGDEGFPALGMGCAMDLGCW